MDRDRGTDGLGQGHRLTATGKQTERTGTQKDTGMDNFNGQLTKKLRVKSVKFLKILQN
jgi:hypothetical protein